MSCGRIKAQIEPLLWAQDGVRFGHKIGTLVSGNKSLYTKRGDGDLYSALRQGTCIRRWAIRRALRSRGQ
ncbi:hypothetical protein RSAG8_05864, partial [Rhizoctonia solani AG-8 WAC10335]